MANGKTGAIAYQPGPNASSSGTWSGDNPFAKTVLTGPFNYTTDASLFKVFPITERVNLRFNMDVFNLLNMQGFNNPSGTDGTENLTSSYNTARQVAVHAATQLLTPFEVRSPRVPFVCARSSPMQGLHIGKERTNGASGENAPARAGKWAGEVR